MTDNTAPVDPGGPAAAERGAAAEGAASRWAHRVTGLGVRPGRRRFSRQGPDPDLLATLYGSTAGTLLGHSLGLVVVVALYARLAPGPLLLLWVVVGNYVPFRPT